MIEEITINTGLVFARDPAVLNVVKIAAAQDNVIHYGFGRDYLQSWGIKEAMREIWQNFLDFGEYDEESFNDGGTVHVALSNEWVPESLDFLRIGNSRKGSNVSIGKHGEGLKMSFLILLRQGFDSRIITPKYIIIPDWYVDKEIGECFCMRYTEHDITDQKFAVEFTCNSEDYDAFKQNLVLKHDVIFSYDYYGEIVNKPTGNIYSGGLFVCHHNNISNAYNISPEHLPLDRDRQVPQSFDVSWATSKILDRYGKWSAKDLPCSDTRYIEKIPADIVKDFRAKKIGNDIQFIYKDSAGSDKIVSDAYVKAALKKEPFFANIIKKLKIFIAKQIGLYDLLIEFKKKHVYSTDAIADFNVIIERVAK